MNPFLAAAEGVYRGINRLRRALYRKGILQSKRLPRPVVSVGNLAAGGTGKTPAVIAIARFLEQQGLRVAVLTRGYGRGEHAVDGVVSKTGSEIDSDKYGDEPVLIKQSISGDVIVGSSRYRNAAEYLKTNSCDVFLLDDGFQHLQLSRDVDVVIDTPSRFHREGRSALRDATVVVPRRLRLIVPDALRGRPLFAFSGLADNAQFFASLRAAGLELRGTRGFPDHHRYRESDLAALRRDAGDALLVTTGKDAVKLSSRGIVRDIFVVDAAFEIEPAVLDMILSRVQQTPAPRARKRRKSRMLQRIEYFGYRAVAFLVGSMTEEAVSRWGARLGSLMGRILRKRDRLALRNLAAALPERSASERRRILDDCWRHFGRELLIYLQLQNLSLEEVAARCPFEHAEILEEAMARGRGTLLISAHWGGWEVAGLAIMSMVRNVRTVARPLDNELLERDLQLFRKKTGAEVVDRRRAARVLLKGLSENGVVILLPDQAVLPREGVLVDFLGRPAWTTPAPAKMALRGGSTIVFGFCIPDGLRHRLEFCEPIRVDLLSDEERDPVALTRRINDVLSRRIRERPELWLWMHDRWKATGESDVTNGE